MRGESVIHMVDALSPDCSLSPALSDITMLMGKETGEPLGAIGLRPW